MLPCYNFLFVSHNLPYFVWICFWFIFHFWLLFLLLTSTSMGKEVGCIFFFFISSLWLGPSIYLFIYFFALVFCFVYSDLFCLQSFLQMLALMFHITLFLFSLLCHIFCCFHHIITFVHYFMLLTTVELIIEITLLNTVELIIETLSCKT